MVTSDVASDYGALLIGGLLAFGLSGCVGMQFIVYCRTYPSDSPRNKTMVVSIWLLDLCHSAFICAALWDSIIVQYGDVSRQDRIPWSVGPTVELTAMLTFVVQSFFAYRIYRLSKKKLTVAGPLALLAFCRLVAASISMGEMLKLKQYTYFDRTFPSWVFTLGLVLSVAVDVMTTIFLCFFLRLSRSSISSTNRIIDTLTLYAVQNGSITSIAAVASLICWLTMPQNRIFLGLHFVIGKFYANSLLATLNSRKRLREERSQGTPSGSNPLPIIFPDNFDGREGDSRRSYFVSPSYTNASID
ncbi:hypothetical protein SERLA73DRAFT_189491 [Serpula lacrymans var. lacrymans S7.3]|uniref:DUF6534 domain-containing protein n=2 Tax=Serpula lacrymans var. lacrymans TaxID=341189 RepID=F8QDR4_SERL3|nr:uncharacterized protein SERLADRAFT_454009 [Serpula lacrymans var. lacrymans S7.9]EGN93735.1 hypothetical protein SERLA73DRAFT_189491 [Serpula lacrymans var. lacrymans S7.3]EGO19103.1 hypothetical protein SERLADRAFT_454009 [Serpula lacrymans var. lacrymans S7.9]